MRIEIGPRPLRALKRHAGRDYPHECCGFLVGRVSPVGRGAPSERRILIDEAVPAENQNRERAHDRYQIHPLAYKRLEDSLRDTPRRIVGFYHSHPDHPSRPSATDLELFGGWPGYVYVIVGVEGRHPGPKRYRVTAWSLEEHDLVTG